MRYFHITYSFPKGNGSIGIERTEFPTMEDIKDTATLTDFRHSEIIVSNIQEFNEADFKRLYKTYYDKKEADAQ